MEFGGCFTFPLINSLLAQFLIHACPVSQLNAKVTIIFVYFECTLNLFLFVLTGNLQERPESKKASFLGKVTSLSQVRQTTWLPQENLMKQWNLGGECEGKWGEGQGRGVQGSEGAEARPLLHLARHWRPEHWLVQGLICHSHIINSFQQHLTTKYNKKSKSGYDFVCDL